MSREREFNVFRQAETCTCRIFRVSLRGKQKSKVQGE